MAKCMRCSTHKEVITIPVEIYDNVQLLNLCKVCILNGFKGIVEELVVIEKETLGDSEQEILENIIQSIPVVKDYLVED